MTTAERIESTLRQALSATEVRVIDESAQHAGHAGAAAGGGHYRVTVVSPLFTGKNSVQRHRLVYAALADDMQQAIHALALTTLAPHERA
jgi:BolA protein